MSARIDWTLSDGGLRASAFAIVLGRPTYLRAFRARRDGQGCIDYAGTEAAEEYGELMCANGEGVPTPGPVDGLDGADWLLFAGPVLS